MPLVVPWHPGAEPSLLRLAGKSTPPGNDVVGDVLHGYGAENVVDVTAARSPAHVRELDGLDDAWEREAARLYPAPSVAELSRLGAPGAAQQQGLVVLLTGLSGSGKSTIAKSLAAKLPAATGRDATLLDGDEVRQMLSAGLGFDRESRELNVKRIGYVAGLIAHHGGTAIAAPIAPFASARGYVRDQAQRNGRFVLVYVSTPLEVCEQRDRKGLYAKARAGEVAEFTGISSPYEEPADADLIIDTSQVAVDDAVDQIAHLIADEQR
jgi:sulfate adenylyltransferase